MPEKGTIQEILNLNPKYFKLKRASCLPKNKWGGYALYI